MLYGGRYQLGILRRCDMGRVRNISPIADRDEKRYNSIFRKLFGYRYFESVSNLQHFLGRPTWEELVARRQNNFLHKANVTDDNSLFKLVCQL